MHSIRPQKLAAIGLDPEDAAGAQPAAGLRRPARLRRRRPLRRAAGLRRHHPGAVRLRRPDGTPGVACRNTFRPSPPTRPPGWWRHTRSWPRCFRRERTGEGVVRRSADVRVDGGLQPGRALLRPALRAAAGRYRLSAPARTPFAGRSRLRTATCARCPTPTRTGSASSSKRGSPSWRATRASPTSASARATSRRCTDRRPRSSPRAARRSGSRSRARLEIPASRMNRLEDLQNDEHLRATGFFRAVDDPAMGTLRFPGVPVLIDGAAPAGAHATAPGRAHGRGAGAIGRRSRRQGERRRASHQRLPPFEPKQTPTMSTNTDIHILGQGFYWQDLKVGQHFQHASPHPDREPTWSTSSRVTGMLEAIFIDATPQHGASPAARCRRR